ncbi:MBL fold metallo-hydrolase [Bacillus sp. FJAT-27264]|uniref:MBL fold metallo-hydrolase n=1 Tax=Paenibacillus sp. (strain DSM 101736 / FJAT-27264) TaxID=1850362 RepID=UPI000807CF2B|nr:MBL fold metallo-hydrolase [Bacillus sp. FJAT-27264]OBZ09576.1 MBL fold metallo-hydrolase [Bacillus sp. FJAT-27264]
MTFLLTIVIVVLILLLIAFLYLHQAPFGKLPSGSRLARIERSPHYRDGKFHNVLTTPIYSENSNLYTVIKEKLFTKERLKPLQKVPINKTDLHVLQEDEEMMVWFGHSSFFIRTGRKNMLFDPIFSPSGAPVSFSKAFPSANHYSPDDMPVIDYLFISHDHWDHLDYATLTALRPKIKQVVCGLGVGSHLEHWGFKPEIITELDWGDTVALGDGFTVHGVTARHYSGRDYRQKRTLWLSFVIEAPGKKIFYSGDSGYGPHFAEVGKQYGPFDLVILENGQYNTQWRFIHMFPNEVLKAANDLRAKSLLPVHAGKFALSIHSWDTPFRRISELGGDKTFHLLMPMIGERVELWQDQQQFERWWESIE